MQNVACVSTAPALCCSMDTHTMCCCNVLLCFTTPRHLLHTRACTLVLLHSSGRCCKRWHVLQQHQFFGATEVHMAGVAATGCCCASPPLYAGRMHVAPPSTRCSIHAAPCCRGTTPNTIHMFLLLLVALVLLLLLHAESLTPATRIGLPVDPPPPASPRSPPFACSTTLSARYHGTPLHTHAVCRAHSCLLLLVVHKADMTAITPIALTGLCPHSLTGAAPPCSTLQLQHQHASYSPSTS
jgi:hypothetical protein